jgi:hypothetical protein
MHRIQEFIYDLEVGKGVWVMRVLVGILLLITLGVWYDFNEFKNFNTREAMEAAQLARSVARGRGFTTQCISPFSLYLVREQQGVEARLSRQPHPDLNTPPLYPLLLAGAMTVVPMHYDIGPRFWRYQPEMIIAVFNQLLFVLTAWLAFRLARQLFSLNVAIVSALTLLGADVLWRFSVSGLSTCLVMLIFTALLWTVVQLEQGMREARRPTRWFVWMGLAAGACLGLGTLTRYAFAWLAVPLAVFCVVYLRPRRALVAATALASALVLVGPWIARNYVLSGTPLGVAGYAVHQETGPFPETRLERSLNPNFGRLEWGDYFRKFCGNTGEILQSDLPKLGGGSWATPFFLVGLLFPFRRPGAIRLRLFLVLSLVMMIVVQALGRTHLTADSPVLNTENLLVILSPGVFVFGVALFFGILDQLALVVAELRHTAITVFVIVCSLPLAFTLLPPRSYPLVYPPYLPPWIQESARMFRTTELMMSDMPWAVAWYGDRSCVWTPLDTGRSFYAIYDEQKPISGLYLTPLTTDAKFLTQVLQGPDWEWSRFAADVLLRTNLPPRFPLQHARKRYTPDQLFLSDSPRWQR